MFKSRKYFESIMDLKGLVHGQKWACFDISNSDVEKMGKSMNSMLFKK